MQGTGRRNGAFEGGAFLAMASTTPSCSRSRHRPGRTQWEAGGIARARCRSCGLNLMRLALSRRWIIANELGAQGPAPARPDQTGSHTLASAPPSG